MEFFKKTTRKSKSFTFDATTTKTTLKESEKESKFTNVENGQVR